MITNQPTSLAAPPKRRRYALRPEGGLLVPRVQPKRLQMWEDEGQECAILERGDYALISVRAPSGRTAEQPLLPEVAQVLMNRAPDQILEVYEVEVGDWLVRIYTGHLWGLVLGEYVGAAADDVAAPAGWTLGAELTADRRFDDLSLGLLDDSAAAMLVREHGGS